MSPDEILKVVGAARRSPRMYGETPSHLAAYLRGVIAGACSRADADVARAWALNFRAERPAEPTDDEACDAAEAVARMLEPEEHWPPLAADEGELLTRAARRIPYALENKLLAMLLRGSRERVAVLEAEVASAAPRLARAEALEVVAACVRREHKARAAWLAALPPGACASPPSEALLGAEAATREALRGLT